MEGRHLDRPPEDWEQAQGTVKDRTAKAGASVLNFREANAVEAPEDDKTWRKVQQLGQESLKMAFGKEMAGPGQGTGANDQPEAKEEEEDDDPGWMDEDSGDEAEGKQGGGNEGLEDANAMLDVDYDTSTWSVHEIESACNTLLEECEATKVPRRRTLATRMLLRLMDRHSSAKTYVEVALETVVNRGVPSMAYGITERVFHIAYLLAAVVSRVSDKLSTLNIVPRMVKMITREADLATRVLQNRVRLRKRRRIDRLKKEDTPLDVRVRQRLVLNMKTDDLNHKWRDMRFSDTGGRLPQDVVEAYFATIFEMTKAEHSEYAELNRTQVVQSGGMIPIVGYLKGQGKLTVLSRAILLNLSEERSLLYPILLSQAVPSLLRGLGPRNGPTGQCQTLDVLDALASQATEEAVLPVVADVTGIVRGLRACQALASLPATRPTSDACRLAILKYFITPSCVSPVMTMLHAESIELFLGAIMVVHKMACTLAYHVVLEELLAVAGTHMERALDALQSHHDLVPVATFGFFAQITTRAEGRDGMITTGAVAMITPLCAESHDPDGQEYVLGLSLLMHLAEHGTLPSVRPTTDNMDVPVSKFRDRLYKKMMSMLAAPAPGPSFTVHRIVSMKCMPMVLRFLVRPENSATHVFDLSKQHQMLGALILDRIARQADARGAEVIFHDAVLVYLAYLIQTNYIEMVEGELERLPKEDAPLFFLSIQAACLGLCLLANCDEPPDARSLVYHKLERTTAINELVLLLTFPRAKYDPLYKHKMECVASAACLVGAIAPRPLTETLPEADREIDGNERASVALCLPGLTELASTATKPLLLILQGCDSKSTVNAACLALARISGANETCATVLEAEAVRTVSGMVPHRPSRPPAGAVPSEIEAIIRRDIQQMVKLTPTFFRLVNCLARLPTGQQGLQASGVFKRAVERMDMGDDGPHHVAVRTEIAIFLGRMANKHSLEFGSTNDIILASKHRVIPWLVQMLNKVYGPRTRFAAAFAIRCLCDDVIRSGPSFAEHQTFPSLLAVVAEPDVAHPLLREVLRAIYSLVTCPGGPYTTHFVKCGAEEALQRIASNITMELCYTGAMDRVGLGDVARDALGALSDHIPVPSTTNTDGPVDEAGHDDDDEDEDEPQKFLGTYDSVGVGASGSLVPVQERFSTTMDSSGKTPLAMLSARSEDFRKELRRRKKYYQLDEEPLDNAPDEGGQSQVMAPVVSVPQRRDDEPQVALLHQNPQLMRTRPAGMPGKPPSVESTPREPLTTPLLKQPRNQMVQAGPPSQPTQKMKSFGLMLDPIFAEDLVSNLGDQSKGEAAPQVKVLKTTAFGGERFVHTTNIMGHRIEIAGNRMVGGRVAQENAHNRPATFDNIHEAVSSMHAARVSQLLEGP